MRLSAQPPGWCDLSVRELAPFNREHRRANRFLRLSATVIFSRELFSEIHRQLCLQLLLQAITGSVDFLTTERPLRGTECQGDRDGFAVRRELFSRRIHEDAERLDIDEELRIARPDLLFEVGIGQSHRAEDGNITENGRKLWNLPKRRLSPESLERF